MGSAVCSGDACADDSACTRCGGDAAARPGFDGIKEYTPQGKNAGLKEESLEPTGPAHSTIGKAIEELEHRFHHHAASGSEAAPGDAKHDEEGGIRVACEVVATSIAATMQAAAHSAAHAIADLEGRGGQDREASGSQEEELKGRGFDPFQATAHAAAKAKAELTEYQSVVHRGHCSLRIFCLGVALALLIASIIGVLNLFHVSLEPFVYLTSAYNVIFASVIIVMDVDMPVRPYRLVHVRKRLFEACWFLSTHQGKAFFYFYVGSINLILLPDGDLRLAYLVTGGMLVFAAIWIWTDGCGYCCCVQQSGAGKAASRLENAAISGLNRIHEMAVGANIEMVKVKSHFQNHPLTLKLICFLVALALFVASVLSLIDIFGAFFEPYHYLMAVYNLFFAMLIALLDARREWVARCWNIRVRVLKFAPCLGWLAGRACFFFYVGSINLMMLPDGIWRWVYICIGAALCVAGSLMILHRYVCRSKDFDDTMGFQEET